MYYYILSILLFFSSCCYGQLKHIVIGDEMDISQHQITILNHKNLDKNKPIILDFWATWCAPCIAAFPHLDSIQAKFKEKIQIIALSDEKKEVVEKFLAKKKYKQLIFSVDNQQTIFKLFDIQARPLTAFLSPQGKLLWIGSSENLEEVLHSFFKEGKITDNQKYQELTAKYYTKAPSTNLETREFFNYQISVSEKNTEYFAKTQKGMSMNEPINIQYKAASVTEVIQDILSVPDLRFKNNREDLDTILINLVARSNISKLTYKVVSERIITDLEMIYSFKIKKEQKNVPIYQLKIIDDKKLIPFQNNIVGGGMIEKKGNLTNIIRLNLEQIATHFEKKLKMHIMYLGNNNSKYNIVLQQFSSIEELNKQLSKNFGLILEKDSTDLTFFELK